MNTSNLRKTLLAAAMVLAVSDLAHADLLGIGGSAGAGAAGAASGGLHAPIGGPVGGTGATSQGGTSTGGTTPTGGSSGSATGGSDTGGSATGGSSGTGGATGGSMAGASTGGAMGGAGSGGTSGTTAGAGMGGTTAGTGMGGAGKGGTGGTMAGAGQGGTTGGAGMGGAGKGGTGGMPASVLVHRYSFSRDDSTAMDSVGTAHGTIVGGSQAGGVVTLMGGSSDQYVQLPANILDGLTNATFEAWASWTGGTQNWQRVWDFGTSDAGDGAQGMNNTASPYFFFTPRATATSNANCTNSTASMPRVAITGMGPANEDCAFGTSAFPMGTLTHIAVVIDGTMTLYIGGSAVGGPVTLNYGIANVAGHGNNWLGRSQFSADTEFAGTISEFRIYNTARSSSQIAASATAGPDSVPTQ